MLALCWIFLSARRFIRPAQAEKHKQRTGERQQQQNNERRRQRKWKIQMPPKTNRMQFSNLLKLDLSAHSRLLDFSARSRSLDSFAQTKIHSNVEKLSFLFVWKCSSKCHNHWQWCSECMTKQAPAHIGASARGVSLTKAISSLFGVNGIEWEPN